MNRISSEVEAKIIDMWFQGVPRDEIARILMVGGGTVSAILNSLPTSLQALRDLSKTLKKLNCLPADALKGAKLLQLLKEHRVNPEQLPIFLEVIQKSAIQAGYQPEKVIQAAIKLVDLENQAGVSYPEALKEFETLTQLIPKRKKEHSKLLLEIQRSNKLYSEAFEQAKLIPRQLSEFIACKATLREYGIDINDPETISKMLGNITEVGGNPKRLVSLMKKHGSIAKLLAYFEKQLPTRQDELADLLCQIKECQQIVLQLENRKNQLLNITNSQEIAIFDNNLRLNLIQANIMELEKRRQAIITWIGRQFSLPQIEIDNLRLNSQYEIVLAAIDNVIRDLQARVMRPWGDANART